jgi:CO/xanthine dehydrogenase Mo-binding subunit
MDKGRVDLDRRFFLKATASVAGGLLVMAALPACGVAPPGAEKGTGSGSSGHTAWVRISRDNVVTVSINHSEMGQGITTALAMLVAEELEADWSKVRTEFSPVASVYRNPAYKLQMTGGSTSVRTSWEGLRRAAATARELLVRAAGQTWGVPPEECRAVKGTVVHQRSGQSLTYGALADQAARLPAPEEVRLKSPREFELIGTRLSRLDTPEKAKGSAIFGIDVRMPGLLAATVVHPPVFGSHATSYDAKSVREVAGVRHVLAINEGIAVVADTFWQAKKGAEALKVTWDKTDNDRLTTDDIWKRWEALSGKSGSVVRQEGGTKEAMTKAARTVGAVYMLPYQAHATPEPMNCTAFVQKNRCDVWAPTQNQETSRELASRITGLGYDRVHVHTTLLGGGFGRRIETDYVAEALQISKATGKPVKVVWTRREDMGHDFYRPATYNVLKAALDSEGKPFAWTHRIVAPAFMDRLIPQFVPSMLPQSLPRPLKDAASWLAGTLLPRFRKDTQATEGAADLPYSIDNILVEYLKDDPGIPTGFWRSVYHSQNAFAVESFVDEIAAATRQDPYLLRRSMLGKHARMRAVLDLAAEKARWGRRLPEDKFRGIAFHDYNGTSVAQVAEVSVDRSGRVKVHRIVCAVDCGIVINPRIVEAQIESAVAFGLTATLKSSVTIRNGRVEQGGLDDFPLLRADEMPKVEVHLVPSEEPPSGIGEPGVPPVAPAVTNAIFAATGRRLRTLPVKAGDLRSSP